MTISYELAKQLKDSGFPQKGEGIFEGGEGTDELPDVYLPTLEELIDSCGHQYFSMEEQSFSKLGTWYALKRDVGIRAEGSTPTEAVAYLYLALHKE